MEKLFVVCIVVSGLGVLLATAHLARDIWRTRQAAKRLNSQPKDEGLKVMTLQRDLGGPKQLHKEQPAFQEYKYALLSQRLRHAIDCAVATTGDRPEKLWVTAEEARIINDHRHGFIFSFPIDFFDGIPLYYLPGPHAKSVHQAKEETKEANS